MSKDYYKGAIIICGLQLMLLAIFLNNILLARFDVFQDLPSEVVEIALAVGILVLNIVAVFMIRNLYLSGIRAKQLLAESLRIKHIEEQNRIYRQHQHDLNNQLLVISGLARMGAVERLIDYVDSYADQFNQSLVLVETGVRELDILFFTKISEAREKGISVNYQFLCQVNCSSQRIVMLVAILSNLLDNAIEASVGLNPGQIDIKLAEDDLDYIFMVGNKTSGKENLAANLSVDGYTSKQGSPRGEGMGIIRRNVRSLKGEFFYEVDEGYVQMFVELPKSQLS